VAVNLNSSWANFLQAYIIFVNMGEFGFIIVADIYDEINFCRANTQKKLCTFSPDFTRSKAVFVSTTRLSLVHTLFIWYSIGLRFVR